MSAAEQMTISAQQAAIAAGNAVLRGEGDGTYSEAEDAIRLLIAAISNPAMVDVAAERARQIEQLGWTHEHDDEHHDDRALPRAAACYALADPNSGDTGPFWITHLQAPRQVWPYRWEWKVKDRRTNLVRAAALLMAEIERFDRATAADISK